MPRERQAQFPVMDPRVTTIERPRTRATAPLVAEKQPGALLNRKAVRHLVKGPNGTRQTRRTELELLVASAWEAGFGQVLGAEHSVPNSGPPESASSGYDTASKRERHESISHDSSCSQEEDSAAAASMMGDEISLDGTLDSGQASNGTPTHSDDAMEPGTRHSSMDLEVAHIEPSTEQATPKRRSSSASWDVCTSEDEISSDGTTETTRRARVAAWCKQKLQRHWEKENRHREAEDQAVASPLKLKRPSFAEPSEAAHPALANSEVKRVSKKRRCFERKRQHATMNAMDVSTPSRAETRPQENGNHREDWKKSVSEQEDARRCSDDIIHGGKRMRHHEFNADMMMIPPVNATVAWAQRVNVADPPRDPASSRVPHAPTSSLPSDRDATGDGTRATKSQPLRQGDDTGLATGSTQLGIQGSDPNQSSTPTVPSMKSSGATTANNHPDSPRRAPGRWNISKKGWKMSIFTGKEPQLHVLELFIDKWRSLAAEKYLTGKGAVWALLDFIRNPALEKLEKRMGSRLRDADDPELLISELRKIYDTPERGRRILEEFYARNQAKGESLRDYMDTIQALYREFDPLVSTKGVNYTVFERFMDGIRDPELTHPAMKRPLLAYAYKLSLESEDFLDRILREAEGEKQATRNLIRTGYKQGGMQKAASTSSTPNHAQSVSIHDLMPQLRETIKKEIRDEILQMDVKLPAAEASKEAEPNFGSRQKN